MDVIAGRVTTLDIPNSANLASVRITNAPSDGNVTVNPDNTLALVMTTSNHTGSLSFGYEATYTDGTVTTFNPNLNVLPGSQAAGWGQGQHYMLQTDQNDDVIVEYGDNHREVYVSGSQNALSLSDIAALEGLPQSAITTSWLINNPQYGSDPTMALAEDAGMQLWAGITGKDVAPNSNWLLFERGYQYDNTGNLIDRGTTGESELNPVHITAYGQGTEPVITSQVRIFQDTSENVVFSDLQFTGGIMTLDGANLLFDNNIFSENELNFQNIDNLTIRNSDLVDVIRPNPSGGSDWNAHVDRIQGIFVSNTDGILMEGILADHNGWEQGYDPGGSGSAGQPPSMFSHNIYLQWNTTDVTFRDNIVSQGASFGAQLRGGGFIEDNAFLGNNAAVNFLGGNYNGHGPVGNYTLFADNVITDAGFKKATMIGALSLGMENRGNDTTILDNIIAHLADPNDPAALAATANINNNNDQWLTKAPIYDDTVIYNWVTAVNAGQSGFDQNVNGLNPTSLDQVTIQNFAAAVLGQPGATLDDLVTALRAQAPGGLSDTIDADSIVDYFQQGFGIADAMRAGGQTLRFVPDNLGDGIRWDSRLNWDTNDLPGTHAGDSVDLAGNWVYYGGTTTINDLDFGSGGQLNVTHGYLQIDGNLDVGANGGTMNIDLAGQVWTDGYTDQDLLDLNIDGGRFANTGLFQGAADIDITDNAQVILATSGATFDLDGNSTLDIYGDGAKVGFDGQGGGTSVLRLEDTSTLGFNAQNGELGTISEFRSGHFGPNAPDVQSGVNLGSSTLSLDLTGLNASSATLIQVDELVGSFSNVNVTGLAGNQDATVTIDYDTDTVTLQLGTAGSGSGAVNMATLGDPNALAADPNATAIWDALTNGFDLPASGATPGLSAAQIAQNAFDDALLTG